MFINLLLYYRIMKITEPRHLYSKIEFHTVNLF